MRMSEAAALIGARRVGEDVEFVGCGTDSRTIDAGTLFVALRGPTFDGHAFVEHAVQRGAVAALVEDVAAHGAPTLVAADSLAALGALAGGWRARFALPLVAVTGSNGKTTVKEMIAAILGRDQAVLATRGNLNNLIGLPLTLLDLDQHHAAAVVEMGANRAGEIARMVEIARPDVGIVTQCAPAHLEGFGSLDGVARAKGELFAGLADDATAIINADDAYADLWRSLAGGRRRLTFALEREADVRARWQPAAWGSLAWFDLPDARIEVRLPLLGRHNVANAAAAVAAAVAMEVDGAGIVAGLESLGPVKGRLQPRRGRGGWRIIDDTYNANPASLRAGLDVLVACDPPRWLVLGDMAELGPAGERHHRSAGALARELGVEHLWTTGVLSRASADAFGAGARHYDDQAELIDALAARVPEGATVLVKGSRSMRMERVVDALTAEETACCWK
jgi:UDP-N-acetylmuramoyl-tripeptide--D-alanyl-D-alanine ligase